MKYLAHLRSQADKKINGPDTPPSELTKLGSVGFGGGGNPALERIVVQLPAGGASANADAWLERRRAYVVRELLERPEQRVAFHARNAPLVAEPGNPVSVVIAVRTEKAGIVSAELSIPRDRFDWTLFCATLEETSRRPS